VGSLLLNTGRNKAQITVKGPVTSFTQDDINKGFFPTLLSLSLALSFIHISMQRCIVSHGFAPRLLGHVEYIHEKGESGGSFSFKFNLEDPEGNRVIDQSFFISVLGEPRIYFGTLKSACSGTLEESYFETFPSRFLSEDRLPPTVVVNKGLVLDENTLKKITTLQLSSTDQDSEPDELIYRITKQPQLGHLEHSSKPGTQKLTNILTILQL